MSFSSHLNAPLRGLMMAACVATPAAANELVPYAIPIWTGAYIGVHGGGNWLELDSDGFNSESTQNAFGGFHLGLNYQYSAFVFGAEADINIESTSFDVSFDGANFANPGLTGTAAVDQSASGSLRLRAGLPLADSLMLYATAGYAWTSLDYDATGSLGGTPVTANGSLSFSGLVYGIGAEALVTPNLLLRIEALRYDYTEEKLTVRAGNTSTIAIDPSSDVIRAGLSWRFN